MQHKKFCNSIMGNSDEELLVKLDKQIQFSVKNKMKKYGNHKNAPQIVA